MAKIELKRPVIEEISGMIDNASSVLLVNYSGITVEQDTRLRRSLREAGVSYKVYKNTMMRLAFKGTACEELDKHLESTNALAVSKDDATAPARILADFAKECKSLELVAGIVEGKYFGTEEVNALSKIPPRDILIGRLLGSIQSPIASFARVLNQIAQSKAEPAPAAESDN